MDSGLLMDFSAMDSVTKHRVRSVQVETIPATPVVGQGTEGLRSWINKFAFGVGPAGNLRQAEMLFADDFRMGPVSAIEGDTMGADESAGPAGRHAKQVGVKEHAGVGREAES